MPKLFEGKEKRLCPDKAFDVRYLGKTLAAVPGVEGIEQSINTLLMDTVDDKRLPRMFLTISQEGIYLKDASGRRDRDKFFPLKEISFALMNSRSKRVFAFNHHVSRQPVIVECNAMLCATAEVSGEIGSLLYFAFKDNHFVSLRKRRSEDPSPQSRNTDTIDHNTNTETGHSSQSVDSLSVNSAEEIVTYTPRSSLVPDSDMPPFCSLPNNSDNLHLRSAHNDTDYLSYGSSQGSASPQSCSGDQDTRELHSVVDDMIQTAEKEKDQLNPTLV